MSLPDVQDLRAALDDYSRAVRESRASALEARARIQRAAAALDELCEMLGQRQRHAAKRAAKRERQLQQ